MRTVSYKLTVALLASCSSSAIAQTSVYDNTDTSLHFNFNAGLAPFGTVGNQVVLAGSPRNIVEFAVVVHVESDAPATLGLQPYFFGSESDP
jgi:hypothetical protein